LQILISSLLGLPLPTLLTSSKSGDKCKHAHDWGIDVVNHLWLEETYAKWQVQSVTIPRYTHFPPQTNLTEIVDKTEIQEEGIQDFFNPRGDDYEDMPDTTTNGSKTVKSQNVQSSYVQAEKKTPAPATKVSPTITKIVGPETPGTESTRAGTPGSMKRKAAENATAKLHDVIMPDVLLWEKEKNRKRIPEEPKASPETEKKRKLEKRKSEEKENIIEGVAKKVKKESETAKDVSDTNKIVLLVTGASNDLINPSALKVFHIHSGF
jgi:twin BRCT domain